MSGRSMQPRAAPESSLTVLWEPELRTADTAVWLRWLSDEELVKSGVTGNKNHMVIVCTMDRGRAYEDQ